MQPWKISVGFTVIILAVAAMVGGEHFAYLQPHLQIIVTDYWMPVAWYGGLAVVTLLAVIYAAARALGLADMGLKVDLMERSIRRGGGGTNRACREAGARGPGTVPRRMKQQTREAHMKNNHTTVSKRIVLLVSILRAFGGRTHGARARVLGSKRLTCCKQAFTGPIARGLSLIAVVVGGLMFAFGEGGSQEGPGRDHLRPGNGHGRGQLSRLALLMERGKTWRGYPALSKPLTIMGVERRWFLLSATLGLALWNAINSIVAGALIFAVLYGVGFWAWKQDPNMLEILRASAKFRARYDPGKWAAGSLDPC